MLRRSMPARPLRIAIAQSTATGGDVAANVHSAERIVAQAGDGDARLVVFPELSLTGYELERIAASPAMWFRQDDARLDGVRRACAKARVNAILGAPWRTADEQPRIAAIVLTSEGDFNVSYKEFVHGSEASMFAPGEAAVPFEVDGWWIAIAICFDAAHPRHAEAAARNAADVYVTSALYVVGEERRLDLHQGARAMDNRLFAALANYAGETGTFASCGSSGVWRPTGEVLTRAPAAEETLLFADLDPSELRAFRP
jgi:5-aminopentanamidase